MVPVLRSCQSPLWIWLVNHSHSHLHCCTRMRSTPMAVECSCLSVYGCTNCSPGSICIGVSVCWPADSVAKHQPQVYCSADGSIIHLSGNPSSHHVPLSVQSVPVVGVNVLVGTDIGKNSRSNSSPRPRCEGGYRGAYIHTAQMTSDTQHSAKACYLTDRTDDCESSDAPVLNHLPGSGVETWKNKRNTALQAHVHIMVLASKCKCK